MMTLLSFMEKIYSDTKTLSMIYIIGSILLFIFIVLLIFSLRKPANKTTKIIEEPNINNNEAQEELKEEGNNATDEPKEEIIEENKELEIKKEKSNLENILNVTEQKEVPKVEEEVKAQPEVKEEPKEEINNISSEIPSIDDYVDNIVNKTYEKNEQFSSVYVNTGTIKLEKVLDKLNVDEDIKEEIIPEEEKLEESVKEIDNKLDALKTALEEKKQEENNSLDKLESLKKSLEEKRNNINNKQDDLKNKLEALKNTNSNKLDDLKNKLDNLKNQ